MNSQENSTATRAGATAICCTVPAAIVDSIGDEIERAGGMIAQAQAAKHLSDLLMAETHRMLNRDRGQPTGIDGMRSYQISDSAMETIDWLLAEVWGTTRGLARMVDTLQQDMLPLANAAYDALQAQRPAV